MGKPTDELRARLNELGVEYDTYDLPNGEHGVSWIDGNDIEWEAVQRGENFEIHALQLVTPEQAIAATVGKRRSIPSMSKMEGVVCKFLRKIAPDRDWMYLGEVEHAWIAELVNTIATDMVGAVYGIRFAPTFDFPPETMVGETVFDSEGNAIGWIVDATVDVGTCRAVVCNQSDCVHNREYRCACTDLEIQDQECMTYRCRDIDYENEEEE